MVRPSRACRRRARCAGPVPGLPGRATDHDAIWMVDGLGICCAGDSRQRLRNVQYLRLGAVGGASGRVRPEPPRAGGHDRLAAFPRSGWLRGTCCEPISRNARGVGSVGRLALALRVSCTCGLPCDCRTRHEHRPDHSAAAAAAQPGRRGEAGPLRGTGDPDHGTARGASGADRSSAPGAADTSGNGGFPGQRIGMAQRAEPVASASAAGPVAALAFASDSAWPLTASGPRRARCGGTTGRDMRRRPVAARES
jgi:hypothetical protein